MTAGCWWGAMHWGWAVAEAGLQRRTGATWGAMLEVSWAWQEMETGCCHLDGRDLNLPCGWSGLILAGCQWWRDGIYCPGEAGSAGPHPRSLLTEPSSERGEAPWFTHLSPTSSLSVPVPRLVVLNHWLDENRPPHFFFFMLSRPSHHLSLRLLSYRSSTGSSLGSRNCASLPTDVASVSAHLDMISLSLSQTLMYR